MSPRPPMPPFMPTLDFDWPTGAQQVQLVYNIFEGRLRGALAKKEHVAPDDFDRHWLKMIIPILKVLDYIQEQKGLTASPALMAMLYGGRPTKDGAFRAVEKVLRDTAPNFVPPADLGSDLWWAAWGTPVVSPLLPPSEDPLTQLPPLRLRDHSPMAISVHDDGDTEPAVETGQRPPADIDLAQSDREETEMEEGAKKTGQAKKKRKRENSHTAGGSSAAGEQSTAQPQERTAPKKQKKVRLATTTKAPTAGGSKQAAAPADQRIEDMTPARAAKAAAAAVATLQREVEGYGTTLNDIVQRVNCIATAEQVEALRREVAELTKSRKEMAEKLKAFEAAHGGRTSRQ
ncbi:hypothetical protein CONPUDRAFT_78477 [Coniophora puteana RWD-64-598 SS2]|uniref:Uncharacterized protein n=1 Tax=Coniophora puteana (strain RWD-64-598) TaxID=741705 RepID=R7SDJ2_CONPW|nr:uncharacterized protein CONPUDRAFT_78477 [Coniophora puteana RWD-64-598 SS2]EIW73827.1 hypothetical protein CONPUDRAFT_78477 [Coniophora puteana RWD-64-598 SS2]